MGLFDDFKKVVQQAEGEIKKSGLDQRLNELEQGLNKTGKDIDQNLKNQSSGTAYPPPPSQGTSSAGTRQPHPGYTRITAWVKSKYSPRISGIADPSQKKLELEQMSAEACSGLSPKAKKGFLDYLKSQNYEQLLK